MSDVSDSKFLSLILRHDPGIVGVTLDTNGWVDVDALLTALADRGSGIDFDRLEQLVANCPKQRCAFSLDGERIRANQGHSVEIDLDLQPATPPETLYHGTVAKFLAAIIETGLTRQTRHHVHLSPDVATATRVGQRRGRPVILVVAASKMHQDGHTFYRSANGVWLTDTVPPQYLSRN
jgi:putative RNA 2'-phosphotransferase